MAFWANLQAGNMFDSIALPACVTSIDVPSVVLLVFGIALFYILLQVALRIIGVLFWPMAFVVTLMFLSGDKFYERITESAKCFSNVVTNDGVGVS